MSSGGGGQGGSGGAGCAVACDDGDYCNGVEACVDGQCVAGSSPCDDGISCTVDMCDENQDSCTHTPSNALCDNGINCDGTETCDAVLDCQSGQAPSCNDNVSCTNDFCDLTTDACAHVPSDSLCSDGLLCNGVESCDATAGCQMGTPVVCTDAFGCTMDSCSEAAGGCVHTPNSALCNDNLFCNGVETCSPSQGCVAGAPPSCNDNVACTTDSCDNGLAACVHTTNDSYCDDGIFCNGEETCSATQNCVTTGPVTCPSDGIGCTVDACDEITLGCTYTPNASLCSGGEFCSAVLDCIAAPPCSTDAQCQDGDLCNGVETCEGEISGVPNSGICTAGTAVVCDDGVACTLDSCDPGTGTCSILEIDAFCENGLACDGVATCDSAQGCIAGTPMNCADGFGCTIDQCFEPGFCSSFPSNAQCDDGNFCNGAETCSTTLGCQPGAGSPCNDDGIACTVESCDDQLGCIHTPDNDLCPCGQTCDPQSGCGNFCQIATCQGKVYACGDCVDNDGDCHIDSADSQCLGPCDNTENSFFGGIPGQNNSPCKSDCYFDQDTGAGNDDCYWSHKCDPLEVAPNYPPEGSQCSYNPNANIPGYGGSCAQAFQTQSAGCGDYCGPLTPNGCDCFGCCAIPGAPTTVWLGSENPSGTGSCTLANVANPAMCKPCTQVPACLNTCDTCEICIGKPTLPPECTVQICENGEQVCGQPGQDPCAAGYFCVTGCCQQVPS
ncbi:MAG: hypothetical protein HOV80_13335 [Polyangiaceae bacterium]|nr:hypothetical protein [Polyangiaceae bacterium]